MTTAVETDLSQINLELIDAVTKLDNDAALNRGLSWIARNRILIALAQPAGLSSLSYGEGHDIEQIREAIRAAGTWLLRVADEAV